MKKGEKIIFLLILVDMSDLDRALSRYPRVQTVSALLKVYVISWRIQFIDYDNLLSGGAGILIVLNVLGPAIWIDATYCTNCDLGQQF